MFDISSRYNVCGYVNLLFMCIFVGINAAGNMKSLLTVDKNTKSTLFRACFEHSNLTAKGSEVKLFAGSILTANNRKEVSCQKNLVGSGGSNPKCKFSVVQFALTPTLGRWVLQPANH